MAEAQEAGPNETTSFAWPRPEQRAAWLENIYARYNHRQWVSPDPLEFLYRYDELLDREVVGLIASSLAYGRVQQILRSVERALAPLGPRPQKRLLSMSRQDLCAAYAGFKHRFATDEHLAELLWAARRVIGDYGSIEACVAAGAKTGATAAESAALGVHLSAGVHRLYDELTSTAGSRCGHLLPDPGRGSACKRLWLYMRWMVRRDAVDPGGWDLDPAGLVVPLDTHMHRLGRALGLSSRRAADGRTAEELTAGFGRICPRDPVRYDFALTRLGINPQVRMQWQAHARK